MKVVHLETGRHLYGGAQQVAYLLSALPRELVDSHLVCVPDAQIGAAVASLGLPVHELPMTGDLDLAFIGRFRRLLRQLQPDLVHIHSRRGADVLGGLAARRAKVPAILSRRVDNPEPWLSVRFKYPLFDAVLAISNGVRDALRASGVSQAIEVVRSSVDPAPWREPAPREEFLRSFDLDETAITIGVVAQLIMRKGHHVLLQALPPLVARHPNLRVLCFGQGSRREALEAAARELGLSEVVRFVGFHKDLSRWMGHFDLLAHPALMEGLGVTLLQAAAAGVPVIACRAGGMPEAVHDGVNGILVPPGEVDPLREALARLLDDAALRQRYAEAGRRLADTEFSIAAMAEGTLAAYRAVLASAGR
ncbi:glycosyltransferase [Algiphilus sp. W345]|uniref:Glycosyltransferase n=1 Tax=Banduia mediterranea TaxID=3075609 RepID=A0ABU2WGV9_9GAMM|nr:glycosyltransferase [Algiphilus sp. W345]MDT0497106.1 glycosyltransferase [Algiphilus sp. W345]